MKSQDQQLAPVVIEPTEGAMTVPKLLGQVALIQQVMSLAMKDGEHYGRIPGCGEKKSLLKPGAEKLCLTFDFGTKFDVDERNLEGGHREYRVTARLFNRKGGNVVGEGVGTCLTTESKYRYTKGDGEVTDKPVPRAYWDVRQEDPAKAQELIGGKGFGTKKVDGKGWMITRGGGKVEHTNPADHYNTVLKMAKKRALVDAVLTATAASDIFTQDLEDIEANLAAAGVRDTSNGRATTGSVSPRGNSNARALPAPSAPAAAETWEDVDSGNDFRETRIHFGKLRGLMLSELTPQQIHWFESEWMPKKEVNGPTSVEDIALINALKAYRDWRGGSLRSKSSPHGGQASAAPVVDDGGNAWVPVSENDPDIPF